MVKEINLSGEEVVALAAKYMTDGDVELVQKALDYATAAHFYQVRKSGSLILCTLFR